LYALRPDVSGPATLANLTTQLGDALNPIPITPALLQYLDQTKRLAFLKQWKAAAGKK
jgi:iron(III) transport system substrate-binding protein